MSLRTLLGRLRVEEKVGLLASLVVHIHNFQANADYSIRQAVVHFAGYFSFGINSFYAVLISFALLALLIGFFIRFGYLLTRSLSTRAPLTGSQKRALKDYWLNPIRIFILISVALPPFAALLHRWSEQLRFSGKDEMFFAADTALFISAPFLSWPSLITNLTVNTVLAYTYISLFPILIGVLTLSLATGRTILARRAVFAFILSVVVTFPIFRVLPCQDPNNYFIRNLRNHTLSPGAAEDLATYQPSAYTQNLIAQIGKSETTQDSSQSVPISCFPSTHAIWAGFIVYYLAHISRQTLILTIPWIALLLAGGVFLAQHYVIDYIAAIPFAMLCIWIAHRAIAKSHSETQTIHEQASQ